MSSYASESYARLVVTLIIAGITLSFSWPRDLLFNRVREMVGRRRFYGDPPPVLPDMIAHENDGFAAAQGALLTNNVVALCGSAGAGKSHTASRIYRLYLERPDYHTFWIQAKTPEQLLLQLYFAFRISLLPHRPKRPVRGPNGGLSPDDLAKRLDGRFARIRQTLQYLGDTRHEVRLFIVIDDLDYMFRQNPHGDTELHEVIDLLSRNWGIKIVLTVRDSVKYVPATISRVQIGSVPPEKAAALLLDLFRPDGADAPAQPDAGESNGRNAVDQKSSRDAVISLFTANPRYVGTSVKALHAVQQFVDRDWRSPWAAASAEPLMDYKRRLDSANAQSSDVRTEQNLATLVWYDRVATELVARVWKDRVATDRVQSADEGILRKVVLLTAVFPPDDIPLDVVAQIAVGRFILRSQGRFQRLEIAVRSAVGRVHLSRALRRHSQFWDAVNDAARQGLFESVNWSSRSASADPYLCSKLRESVSARITAEDEYLFKQAERLIASRFDLFEQSGQGDRWSYIRSAFTDNRETIAARCNPTAGPPI